MKFRPYQNEMDDAIYQELIIKNSDRCLVKAFCGTGKSIVMYKGKAFQNHDTLVYVFPSLSLIDQFKTDYLKSNVFIISSDDESTTDEIEIKKFMKTKNKIICITYQSFHLLSQYKINMCVFDEAHHAVGETYQTLIFNNPNIEKSCFFTATPKCANGIDMEKDCNLIFEYSYLRGLAEGYLNPFEILCDFMKDDSNRSIYESIARAYYTSGNNRILTFHSDVNTDSPTSVRNFVNVTEMQKAFKKIGKEISKETKKVIKIPKIKVIGFYSELKLKERRQILNEFDSCKDVYILCSCETMGEGVDTKNANMCVFVDSKTSIIKIIQNIGRVVRKVFGVNKPHSTILLPIVINETKYESCETAEECDAVIRQDMNKDGDFTSILNVLSALKQEDQDLYDICVHYPNEYSPQEIQENLKSQGYQIGEEVDLDEVFERANINQESFESEDEDQKNEDRETKEKCRVDIHSNSLEEPIVTHGSGDKIINILKDGDNYYEIGEGKINPPKQRIKLSVHTNSDIKVLWKVDEINFGSCLLDCEVIDIWNERLEEVRTFLEKEKRIPRRIGIEKKLNHWLQSQKQLYINKKIKHSRLELFEKFLEKYEDIIQFDKNKWNKHFIELKNFIDSNECLPTRKNNKILAKWLYSNTEQYKKCINAMSNKDRREIWEDFVKKYKEYFMTIVEIWKNNYIELITFIDTHNRIPNQHKKNEDILGRWLCTQKKSFKNKKDAMKNEEIYKLWKELIQKYKKLFNTKYDKWIDLLDMLKEFIDTNKRLPLNSRNNDNERKMAKWFSRQVDLEEERQKIWEDFLEEYNEYFTEKSPKKSMKLQEKVEPNENPQQKIQRNKSELSQLHKDYKTKRSDNLHEEFQEDPTKWHHYHEIAEANEETFPTESIPRNQIIQELEKIKTKRPKQVIDMGCGKAFISKHFEGDTRFKFTNIDHVAINETVQSGDISELPFEDDSVEICILSLAMWGSNCKEYISEAHRVLETNGTLYIIEPTKRWTNETPADRLKELLNNFTIKKEIIEKFTMFIAIKN